MLFAEENQFSSFDLGGQGVNNCQKHLLKLLKKLDMTVVERNFENNGSIKRIDKNGIFFANDGHYLWSIFNRFILFKFFEKVFKLI